MVEYVDYLKLQRFYSLADTCRILGLSQMGLRRKCMECGVTPTKDISGASGLSKSDFCKLHNKLYHEDHMKLHRGKPKRGRDCV